MALSSPSAFFQRNFSFLFPVKKYMLTFRIVQPHLTISHIIIFQHNGDEDDDDKVIFLYLKSASQNLQYSFYSTSWALLLQTL